MAKTKALISFLVTAKLIWVFVFAYAKSWFSHDAAHMVVSLVFKSSLVIRKCLFRVSDNDREVSAFVVHAIYGKTVSLNGAHMIT